MAALIPYSADDVIVDYGGFTLHGFQKGTFVKVTPNSDLSKLNMGADGEACLVRFVDKSAKIEITLQQDSAANDWLSVQAAAFGASGGGILPLMVKDLTGRSLHTCAHAWVQKMPETEYAEEDTARVWILETESMQSFTGGRG